MKIHIKNQLGGTVDLYAGMQEYQFGPDSEGTIEVEDGDYIYLDQVTKNKSEQSPAAQALSEITSTMLQYRTGILTRLEALTQIGQAISGYFEGETPVPYQLTEKAEVQNNGKSPA